MIEILLSGHSDIFSIRIIWHHSYFLYSSIILVSLLLFLHIFYTFLTFIFFILLFIHVIETENNLFTFSFFSTIFDQKKITREHFHQILFFGWGGKNFRELFNFCVKNARKKSKNFFASIVCQPVRKSVLTWTSLSGIDRQICRPFCPNWPISRYFGRYFRGFLSLLGCLSLVFRYWGVFVWSFVTGVFSGLLLLGSSRVFRYWGLLGSFVTGVSFSGLSLLGSFSGVSVCRLIYHGVVS